jgi:nucleoid-associated protein EbfC
MSEGQGLGDFRGLIETAQRIQTEMARVRDEIAAKTVEGESGGGLVRCTASGSGEVISLAIEPALMGSADGAARKMLEDLMVAAVNQALERGRELAREEMARVTGGLPIPPGAFGG